MLCKSYIVFSSSQLLHNPLNSPLYNYNAPLNASHAIQHTYPSTNVCSDYMLESQCWLVDRQSDNEALFVSSVDSRTRTRTHSQPLRQNMFLTNYVRAVCVAQSSSLNKTYNTYILL